MGDYRGGRGGDPHLVLSICLGRAKGERGEKKKKKKKPNIFFRPPLAQLRILSNTISMPDTNLK